MSNTLNNLELIAFMESLGFEYHDNEYYKCFTKNEGTCEITMPGAKELKVSVEQRELEARKDELQKTFFVTKMTTDVNEVNKYMEIRFEDLKGQQKKG